MSILSQGLPPRSNSMPILPSNNIQPIHKLKKNKFTDHIEVDSPLPVIELQAIKDKEGEELDSKIKLIQKRNLKKLQGRYETIDRWREKYVPQSSVLLIRQKIQKQNVFPTLTMGIKDSPLNSPSSVNFQVKKDRLPVIVSKKVKNLDANVPDQRQLSRRLELQLMTRLQRNKRYYKKDSIVESMNSFQQQNLHQLINKNKGKVDLEEKSSSLAYKKLKIQHYPQLNVLKKALKNQKDITDLIANPQQNKKDVLQGYKTNKVSNIIELKQSLMNEAIEETPQGWQVQNQAFAFVEDTNQ